MGFIHFSFFLSYISPLRSQSPSFSVLSLDSRFLHATMKSRMHINSSALLLKQDFLKKWIKGFQMCNNDNKNMSNVERKNAIKLSADVAIASTRKPTMKWGQAVLREIVIGDERQMPLVEEILGRKVENRPGSRGIMMKCSKKILRKSRLRTKRIVPRPSSIKANLIAKKLVKERTRVLQSIVPGGKEMDDILLIKETLDYIISLRAQVDVMRHIANAAEKMDTVAKKYQM